MSDEFDILDPNIKKSKRQRLLDELDEAVNMTYDDYAATDSPKIYGSVKSFTNNGKKSSQEDPADWFSSISQEMQFKLAKPSRTVEDVFETDRKKKRKKKKKDKTGADTDFDKEFSAEAQLLLNLYGENAQYVDSLQKMYEHMTQTKSSARGVTKNATDVMANITSARAVKLQIIKEMIALRKTKEDFKMKQRKEASSAVDTDNINDFTASILKKMYAERSTMMTNGDATVSDYSPEEMASIVNDHIESGVGNLDDRSDESEAYLRYENAGITIRVSVNRDDESDFDFVAYDDNGNVVLDYPLPLKNTLSINRSTDIATDKYGQKYHVDWV